MSRYVVALGVILAAVLVLVGCGATTAPTPAGTTAKMVAPMPTSVPAPAAPGRAAVEESMTKQDLDSAATNVSDRLIIRNGSITIIVKNVTDTIGAVTNLANANGGYVLRTDSRHSNDKLIATITIKVPAAAFDDTMAELRKLAVKVDAESSSSQDVTEEYVDLEARLKVYEATEQQLLKFLERTQNVDESLKVYRELNNVRSQIESLKGRMNYLKRSADMSTITVHVRPAEKPKPIVEENGWKPLRVVQDALRSLVKALELLANLAIYLVLFLLPILILIAIPLLILRALRRRWRPRKAK